MTAPAYPPYVAPPKGRISAWWFALGGALLVFAVACFVTGIVLAVQLVGTDGQLSADAARHTVRLSGASQHALFVSDGDTPPLCRVFADGKPLPLLPDDTTAAAFGDTHWVSFASFETSAGEVQVVCVAEAPTIVRVRAGVDDAHVIALGLSFIAGIGLGLLGLAALLVVTILFVRRPKQQPVNVW